MTDLTFFTNEQGQTLADRFNKIIKNNTQFFDVLVGILYIGQERRKFLQNLK